MYTTYCRNIAEIFKKLDSYFELKNPQSDKTEQDKKITLNTKDKRLYPKNEEEE